MPQTTARALRRTPSEWPSSRRRTSLTRRAFLTWAWSPTPATAAGTPPRRSSARSSQRRTWSWPPCSSTTGRTTRRRRRAAGWCPLKAPSAWRSPCAVAARSSRGAAPWASCSELLRASCTWTWPSRSRRAARRSSSCTTASARSGTWSWATTTTSPTARGAWRSMLRPSPLTRKPWRRSGRPCSAPRSTSSACWRASRAAACARASATAPTTGTSTPRLT
mmetsp:Transcript_68169/g.181359  ORF Transcript_68169/g.181359 Transcript_68169/m.181359 type:complete len:221 (+) Transcript_68169:63-725(+)